MYYFAAAMMQSDVVIAAPVVAVAFVDCTDVLMRTMKKYDLAALDFGMVVEM